MPRLPLVIGLCRRAVRGDVYEFGAPVARHRKVLRKPPIVRSCAWVSAPSLAGNRK